MYILMTYEDGVSCKIISLKRFFNFKNRRLNSNPQPRDREKSNSNLLSIFNKLALNISCVFL